MMKNIQVIDGAENCTYSICNISERDFRIVFPSAGQNIEFVEDLIKRVGAQTTSDIVRRSTTRRVRKEDVEGIHGTLFFGLLEKKEFYPNKNDDDIPGAPYSRKQRGTKRGHY